MDTVQQVGDGSVNAAAADGSERVTKEHAPLIRPRQEHAPVIRADTMTGGTWSS
eukprot:m.1010989 g.1010989  ORF g.1010989 m.1010989 type:complete len:54 (+) comp24061_c0_seq31:2203-2364(+)